MKPGEHLGPYEIIALIGAGGMGEVYRAKDTRLGRTVAIKVLPAELAADPERRRRFEQEARAASALNHPHICVLYDIGSDQGVDFLVMEYLEGQSLAKRLRQGPMPTSQVFECAQQIASALDRAHRQGIVHRDLKPGNVMLTKSGAKLLDFGLAKLRPADSGASSAASVGPTQEQPLTAKGTILGTLAYMSPEQLEGRDADGRSDLFSFGVMLYEMLTGKPPFEGTSSASVITAIMSLDPPSVSTFAPLTPPGLDRLVRKCLAKDPDARWQSAADLADEFQWLASGSGSATGVVTPSSAANRLRRVWPWVTASAMLLALLVAGGVWWSAGRRPTPPAPIEVKHTQVTFSGDVLEVALSPDGRTIAYGTGTWGERVQVFVRDLGSGRPLQVWEGKRILGILWVPDGLHLVLSGERADDKSFSLYLVPRMGGASQRVPGDAPGAYLAISPDGTRVAGAWQNNRGVNIVNLDSGKADHFALSGAKWIHSVDWSPLTNRLAIVTEDEVNNYVVLTTLPDGQDLRRVYSGKEHLLGACWSPTADALYLERDRGGTTELLRLSTAGKDGEAPEVLLSGLPPSGSWSVSSDGQRLLHTRETSEVNLFRVTLEPRGTTPVAITQGTWSLHHPHVSPDGRWISATRGDEIVKIPIDGGEPVVLTRGNGARWSPDGRQLAFVSDRGGSRSVWVADADGQGAREIKGSENLSSWDVTWISNQRLAWHTPDNRNYRIQDLEGDRKELLVKDPSVGWVFELTFSSKGDQVAVWWNREPYGLWLISWPARIERFVAPNLRPFGWSADGKWIYACLNEAPELVRVAFDTGAIEPVARFASGLDVWGCDLTPDRRSAVCSAGLQRTDAWLIEHFDPHVVPPPGDHPSSPYATVGPSTGGS